jgi:RimJ/RimL family protein N-acetyltransferase
MNIRILGPEDAQAFQVLRLFALQESPSAFGSSHEEERDRTIQQVSAHLSGSPERRFFGYFENDELVAVVGVGREQGLKERHNAFVRSMFVAPVVRGRGIGKQLIQAALAQAFEWSGVEQVSLTVTATNQAAIHLYCSCGFVELGCMPRALKIEAEYYDEITMQHRLGAA